MRRALRLSIVPILLPLVLGTAAVQGQSPAPAALQAEIAASRLEASRAVSLKKLKLNAGLATLHLDDGVLIPASAVGGKTVEMVFLGSGRIEVEPPDEVEAGQLELFTVRQPPRTRSSRRRCWFVGLDAAVSAMLRRPAAQPAADLVRRGEALYTAWRKRGERERMNVDRGILLDALQDPRVAGDTSPPGSGRRAGGLLLLPGSPATGSR